MSDDKTNDEEALARYPWLRDMQDAACPAKGASAQRVPKPKFVLPLFLGGQDLSVPLTRHRSSDQMPRNQGVCFLEGRDGRLFVAQYRNGRWLNRSGRPLKTDPVYWFEMGARG